jgi:conjugal transfer pilus assembly protein TraB
MNDTSPSRSVLRRQYLVLAGVGSVIAGSAAIAVYLGSTGHGDEQPPSKPVTTSILAPGAQVDPRDAWRGQADAQLKALEDSSRETGRRSGEVEARSKELQERLDKLERLGLTPLPPPPVAVPPLRPEFGPDRPATTSGDQPLLASVPVRADCDLQPTARSPEHSQAQWALAVQQVGTRTLCEMQSAGSQGVSRPDPRGT